jgi:hypothetical protein
MYLQVIPPPPPPQPKSLACMLFGQPCPAPPAPPNPDALAATTAAETGLQSQASFTSSNLPNWTLTPGMSGYGMGCNCGCGGKCTGQQQPMGMGLFDSGLDVSGWGVPEWSIVGLSAIGLLAVASSTGKTVKRVSGSARRYRARRRRRAQLQAELAAT